MNVFHLTATKYALMAMRNQRLKVARIDELNDPFELFSAALTEKNYRRKFRQFKEWAAQRYGLLCFSRTWKNPVLWSHYADRHRGVALEFRIPDDDISEVNYTPKRVLLDVDKALQRGTFTQDDAFSLATTKFKHWKYEDEVRVFCSIADCQREEGLVFEPFTQRLCLVGVVIGPACTLSTQEVAQSLPPNREISVTRARLAFGSFNVVRNKEHPIEIVCGAAQPIVPADDAR